MWIVAPVRTVMGSRGEASAMCRRARLGVPLRENHVSRYRHDSVGPRRGARLAARGGAPLKYHLVRFGFESPAERRSNEQYGSDFESSDQVWILAGSPDEALERCCAVVDRSCDVMYAARDGPRPGRCGRSTGTLTGSRRRLLIARSTAYRSMTVAIPTSRCRSEEPPSHHAEERTRTSTPSRAQEPKPCASASFATSA